MMVSGTEVAAGAFTFLGGARPRLLILIFLLILIWLVGLVRANSDYRMHEGD